MTEAEWLECAEPIKMLKAAKARFKGRKLRLFAAACGRLIEPHLPDARSRLAIDTAERFADGNANGGELLGARMKAEAAHRDAFEELGKAGSCLEWAAEWACHEFALKAAETASWMSATPRNKNENTPADRVVQAQLVRDIFGNPFRPAVLDPGWVTLPVAVLAKRIYAERCFERMPMLADALEQAGCADEAILQHCRGPGPHVRGCWVIDLLLGKS